MSTTRLIRAKLQATTIFSGGAIRDLARRDQLWVLPLAAVGILVGLGVLVYTLYGNYRALLYLGESVGQPELLFSFALLASWLLTLLLAVPVVVSVFFFSKDTPLLVALPIRPVSIVLADAFLVYLSSLAAHLLVTVPAVVVYATNLPVGAWFWMCALLTILAGPILPLCVSIVLAFALTAAVNLSRFRVALEVAGFTVLLVGTIALQMVIQRSAMSQISGGPALPAALAARLLSVPRMLPPLAWVAEGFVPLAGAVPLGGFLGLSLLGGFLTLALASRLFLPLTVERAVTRASRISGARYERLRASRSPSRALLSREIAVLSSNSSLLFEAVVEGLVFPLIVVIFSLTLPGDVREEVRGFLAASPWSGLVVLGVLALMSGMNTVSSTSISREGKIFALSLMLPLAGRVQVRAKLLLHLAIFATGYSIDLVIAIGVLRLPPAALVYLVPGGAGFLVLSFCLSIILDLRRPYLTWTHPQQAMKQNMNALAAIGVTMLNVGAHAAVGVGLWALGLGALGTGVAVAGLSVLVAVVALPAVYRYADRRYGGEMEANVRA